MRNSLLIILFAAAIALAYFTIVRAPVDAPLRKVSEAGGNADTTQPLPSAASSAVPAVGASAAVDAKELEFTLPDPAVYREQVVAAGHEGAGLAPVLHDFSQRMAELMQKAAGPEPFARALFDRLRDCAVKNESALLQARTICAVNALRLAEIHPAAFSEKAHEFRSSLPPELGQAVEAMGL
jgi:hypothetical protein